MAERLLKHLVIRELRHHLGNIVNWPEVTSFLFEIAPLNPADPEGLQKVRMELIIDPMVAPQPPHEVTRDDILKAMTS